MQSIKILAVPLCLAVLGALSDVWAADISLSATPVGKTPEIIGYNVAHFMPGSNTETWWKYSGVNGARLWSTPNIIEPPGEDDSGPWGDGVIDEASFLTRRASLRADPLSPTHINWDYFEDKFENSPTAGNIVNLNYAMDRLRSNDIEILAIMHRGVNSYPLAPTGTQAGYEDRWEHWQHFYAQAFHMARHYDVERYQMYNEPDLSENINMSQGEYLERLQLASDAIHSALADVNHLYNKTLTAQVQGPVNSNGNKVFAVPGGEPRNDVTGWGELIIENRNTDLFGNTDESSEIFQKYTFHQYNITGEEAGDKLVDIRQDVILANGGQDTIPIVVGELNVHSAAVFGGLAETLDTPSKSQELGSIFSNYLNNQPSEMYVFKFGQTDNEGGGALKKNGTHYVDNNDGPYNVGGATKGAGVTRLVAKAFKGEALLLDAPSAVGIDAAELDFSASYDSAQGKYFLLANNGNATSATTLNLDFSAWNLRPGVTITVEEVSGGKHGEVVHLAAVPESGLLALNQPAESTWLLSVHDGAPREQVTLGVSDDAMVKSGSNANSNFGASQNLLVKSEPSNPDARNVSFLKFDLGAIDSSMIDQAVLQVSGEDHLSDNGVITHVYGILDDSWSESTITWNNAPNLGVSTGLISGIEDNFIEGVGTSAEFVGHLTSTASEELLQLDITDFLLEHDDQLVSLLITREVRWGGENVDDNLGSLQMASKERPGSQGPELLLFLENTLLHGDFNDDGIVDVADYTVWRDNVGAPAGTLPNDPHESDVGVEQYITWKNNFGSSTSRFSLAANQSTPEPGSLSLLGIAVLLCENRRQRT